MSLIIKKENVNMGFYFYLISSVILFITMYPIAINNFISNNQLNVDNKFYIITTISSSVLTIIITMLNFYFMAFLSYKIISLFGYNINFKKFTLFFGLVLLPISVERILLTLLVIINHKIYFSLNLANILKIIGLNFNINLFLSEIINPFSIIFIYLMLYYLYKLFQIRNIRLTTAGLISSFIFLLLKSEIILGLIMK